MSRRRERARSFLLEPARFLNDPAVMALEPEALGLYAVLFLTGWDLPEPGVFQAHDRILAALSRGTPEQWERHREAISRCFDTTSRPGWWIQRGTVRTHRAQSVQMKRFSERGRRGANKRWVKEEGATSNGTGNADAMQNDDGSRFSVLGTRFLEKKESTPSAPSALRASPPDTSPVVVALPTNRTGIDWPVTERMVSSLAELYPAVDVPQTLREIRGWCDANPTRRKTPQGMARFVNAWMSREQNRG